MSVDVRATEQLFLSLVVSSPGSRWRVKVDQHLCGDDEDENDDEVDNDNDIGDNDDHNYDMTVIGIDISPTKYQSMMNTNL